MNQQGNRRVGRIIGIGAPAQFLPRRHEGKNKDTDREQTNNNRTNGNGRLLSLTYLLGNRNSPYSAAARIAGKRSMVAPKPHSCTYPDQGRSRR